MTLRPRMAGPLAAVLLVLLTVTPAVAWAVSQRYVLIIANNRSLDAGVSPLRYADDDGARYWELFHLSTKRIALFSVFDDETAMLFPEAARAARAPEASAIFAVLDRWNAEMAAAARQGAESELIFIYAGHGDVDAAGEGYVSLQDLRLRRRDLYEKILGPSRASYQHLIIDACKSYYLVKRRGGGGWKDDTSPDSHDSEVRAFLSREDLSSYPRAGVILATSGDQATHEWSRFRAGILSHELRSALSGSADINGDGRIEYSETQAFMAAANARVQHPEARLKVFMRPPQVNRHQPLMDLRDARGGRLLRFDLGLGGKFSVEDDRGVRYADMHKAPDVRFDLVVDQRRAYFLHRDLKEARVAPGSTRVAVARLSFNDSALAARGSLEQSFRRELYQVAYSRGFYDGFCARTGMVPVEGGAEEFVISSAAGAAARPPRPHAILVGYMVSAALLDLPGAAHGVELRYGYSLSRHLSLGASLEYGASSHSFAEGSFRVSRVAALAAAAGRLWPHRRVALRADLALGYQGYFSTGTGQLMGRVVEGSDPMGFRLEGGLGVEIDLASFAYLDLRGGVALELVKIEPDQYTRASPYGAVGVGARF